MAVVAMVQVVVEVEASTAEEWWEGGSPVMAVEEEEGDSESVTQAMKEWMGEETVRSHLQ